MRSRRVFALSIALALGATSPDASAEVMIPAESRVADVVLDPVFRAACAHYYDLDVNNDGLGHDNHSPLGHVFLLQYAQHPPAGGVLREALLALPTIDLSHHRHGCYSVGESPGGTVWPTDTTGSATGVVTIRGFLNVAGAPGAPVAWTMALVANDSTRVRIGGVQVLEEYWGDQERWKKFAVVRFALPGVYPLEIDNATNHVCNSDPVELYYLPRAITELDGACGCGPGCAFNDTGCTEHTLTVVNRAAFQLVDHRVLMARADGSAPPSLAQCTHTAPVVDPSTPESFVACLSDGDCAAPTPVCSDESACVSGCGNSRLDMGETCDDGNRDDGDGCAPTCVTTPGYQCPPPVNLARNSSFEPPATEWSAGGATVEISHESLRGGVNSDNFVADIDRTADWNGGPRSVAQQLSLVSGARYSVSLRYARALDAPATIGAQLDVSETDLPPIALRPRGPTAFRSTIRSFAARATDARISLRYDPAAFTSDAPNGALVDDISVWRAAPCVVLDSDRDTVSDPIEIARGTNRFSADSDDDGVPDASELGAAPGFAPSDTDADGVIDAIDPDDDGDTIPTRDELGPEGAENARNSDKTAVEPDATSDELPDYLDPDDDGDGIPTRAERTLEARDIDGDAIPAQLDTDSDGDTISDRVEAGPHPVTPANSDAVHEATMAPDFLDRDSDNDCVLDSDPSERGAARTREDLPSARVDDNCAAGDFCGRSIAACMPPLLIAVRYEAPRPDASAHDTSPSDATRSDASAPWVLSGDGACACSTVVGATPSRWPWWMLAALVTTRRARAARRAKSR